MVIISLLTQSLQRHAVQQHLPGSLSCIWLINQQNMISKKRYLPTFTSQLFFEIFKPPLLMLCKPRISTAAPLLDMLVNIIIDGWHERFPLLKQFPHQHFDCFEQHRTLGLSIGFSLLLVIWSDITDSIIETPPWDSIIEVHQLAIKNHKQFTHKNTVKRPRNNTVFKNTMNFADIGKSVIFAPNRWYDPARVL